MNEQFSAQLSKNDLEDLVKTYYHEFSAVPSAQLLSLYFSKLTPEQVKNLTKDSLQYLFKNSPNAPEVLAFYACLVSISIAEYQKAFLVLQNRNKAQEELLADLKERDVEHRLGPDIEYVEKNMAVLEDSQYSNNQILKAYEAKVNVLNLYIQQLANYKILEQQLLDKKNHQTQKTVNEVNQLLASNNIQQITLTDNLLNTFRQMFNNLMPLQNNEIAQAAPKVTPRVRNTFYRQMKLEYRNHVKNNHADAKEEVSALFLPKTFNRVQSVIFTDVVNNYNFDFELNVTRQSIGDLAQKIHQAEADCSAYETQLRQGTNKSNYTFYRNVDRLNKLKEQKEQIKEQILESSQLKKDKDIENIGRMLGVKINRNRH